jgi:hypothetical protein
MVFKKTWGTITVKLRKKKNKTVKGPKSTVGKLNKNGSKN